MAPVPGVKAKARSESGPFVKTEGGVGAGDRQLKGDRWGKAHQARAGSPFKELTYLSLEETAPELSQLPLSDSLPCINT